MYIQTGKVGIYLIDRGFLVLFLWLDIRMYLWVVFAVIRNLTY